MIVIKNTDGLRGARLLTAVTGAIDAVFNNDNTLIAWVHVEKEGREVAVNSDGDPVRPGQLAYGEENYLDGGVSSADWSLRREEAIKAVRELLP